MPGAPHGIADHDAFNKRAVIMCAGRADGEEFFTLSCDQHRVCADVTSHQSAVGNVGNCNAFGEIGTGRFFRFLAHATSHFTALEVRLAQASAMVTKSIYQQTGLTSDAEGAELQSRSGHASSAS